jgi:SAM-dependent methyltransferase
MSDLPDTFDRSMAHWSEAGRAEMEAFYRVATRDYRELARSRDWNEWLRGCDRILDVACGSGKFPVALATHGGLKDRTLTLDLLDPSAFSLAEARRALVPPFSAGRSFECRIQDLPADAGPWRAVWATHALYAVPPDELDAALERFVQAMGPEGRGFIAHAHGDSFYLAFHRAYLGGLRNGQGTPFSTAEELQAAFDRLGVDYRIRSIDYVGELGPDERSAAQGFLQRCLFDESVSLQTMESDPRMGPLIAKNKAPDGGFRFPQRVALFDLG